MTVVLFEPHHDDAVLFACYTLLREKPIIVTVFGEAISQECYGITERMRNAEQMDAMNFVQPEDWRSWNNPDVNPDMSDVIADMDRLLKREQPKEVWAPLREDGGHDQHNMVSVAATTVFGNRCRFYATYKRGSARTQTDREVVPQPDWPAVKFMAMSCYISQINLPNCQPWFASNDMLREWIA